MRKTQNEFEIDLLPPFGKPEVFLKKAAAFYVGLLFVGALALKEISNIFE